MNITINLVICCLVFVAKASFFSLNHGIGYTFLSVCTQFVVYALVRLIPTPTLQRVGDSLGETTGSVNQLLTG